MKKYTDILDIVKDNPNHCNEEEELESCPNCDCEISDIYYLFGRYRCDACVNLENY